MPKKEPLGGFADNLLEILISSRYAKEVPNWYQNKSRKEKQKAIAQTELADDIGCADGTVNKWLSGAAEPSLFNLKKLISILDIPANRFLGTSGAGYTTIPDLLTYKKDSDVPLSGKSQEDAMLGCDLFAYILENDIPYEDIPTEKGPDKFRGKSASDMNRILRLALTSRAITITDVLRDEDLESKILSAFKERLRNVIVVKEPKRTGSSGLPSIIKTELVAFLAAKYANPGRLMGLGWGYTTQRFASMLHIPPGQCVAICDLKNESMSAYGYSANSACAIVSARFAKIKSHFWRYSQSAHPASSRIENLDSVYLSVNGGTTDPEDAWPPFSTADYVMQDVKAEAALKNSGLTPEKQKFVCQILGWLVDENGKDLSIDNDIHHSMTLEGLQKHTRRNVPVWLVGARYYKAGATLTAIKNGYVNSLAIDGELTRRLLKLI